MARNRYPEQVRARRRRVLAGKFSEIFGTTMLSLTALFFALAAWCAIAMVVQVRDQNRLLNALVEQMKQIQPPPPQTEGDNNPLFDLDAPEDKETSI